MSAGEATVAGVLAAVAGRWNGYNARPGDLYTAMAAELDSAGLLMTPETAAELDRLRAERHSTNEALSDAAEAIKAKDTRIAAQEQALHDALVRVLATARLRAERNLAGARVAELEQQLAARTFYFADVEGVEGGPTLHTTVEAAKAWVESIDDAGDWFEQDGVWEKWATSQDDDRPTSRTGDCVIPLTVQGDGIVAEAERIRQQLLTAGAQVPVLTEVRDSQRDEIRRLQTEQGELMQALDCGRHDEWDEVVHRARRLAGGSAVAAAYDPAGDE